MEYKICDCEFIAGEEIHNRPEQIRHNLTQKQIDAYIDKGWQVHNRETGDLLKHS